MNFGKVIPFDIVIKSTNNYGFIVTAGDGKFNYTNVDDLIKDLKKIFDNPDEVLDKRHEHMDPTIVPTSLEPAENPHA